jgi:type I restriction enzyme, S subunit
VSLQTFFDSFVVLADSPNGSLKLRELILQLAIEGQLGTSEPYDEPACLLVERIKNTRARLTKNHQIKSLISSPISEQEKFCRIPPGWSWARLDEIGRIVGGGTPRSDNRDYFSQNGIPWLTPADLYGFDEKFIGRGRRDLSEIGLMKSSAQLMPAGTVVFSSRAPIGYVAIASNELATNQGFKSCVPYELEMSEYIYYFLRARKKKLEAVASGTTFKEIPGKQFSQIVIPIPPLAEQKRIVGRIDELTLLCDELKIRQEAKRQSRVRLNMAILAPLHKAASLTPEELEQATTRLAENFDTLYDSIDTVSKLRATILQLAVQGKLVPQDRNDEPGDVLLRRIRAHKEELVKKSGIKRAAPPATPLKEPRPGLPLGWTWARFGDVFLFIEAGWSPECKRYPATDGEWGVLKVSAVSWDNFRWDENKALPVDIEPRADLEVVAGDFLISRANTSELVAKSVVVKNTRPKLMISDKVLRVHLPDEADKEFYNYFNNSQLARDYYARTASGTSSSMKNISQVGISLLPVPVPPLQEQKRIVAKVNQLMSLCDELEAKLRQAEADSEKLMNAEVKHVLNSVRDTSKTAEEVFV